MLYVKSDTGQMVMSGNDPQTGKEKKKNIGYALSTYVLALIKKHFIQY